MENIIDNEELIGYGYKAKIGTAGVVLGVAGVALIAYSAYRILS